MSHRWHRPGGRESGVVVFVALMLTPLPAAAYIDPGTGSALVYVISGIVVSVYFVMRGLYYRVIELASRARYEHQQCDLAFHSESPRYEITFLPVVRALAERGVELTYFTMYERDDSYEALPPGVTHRAIAPGMVGYAYLNHLEAKVLVTTTPQLDVMMFRRSRNVSHYANLQHALSESRYARPFAYDFFDSVLCCGEILRDNIRRIEEIRVLPAKQLLDTGVPHYDELIKDAEPGRPPGQSPLVLVAPSWGPLSIFEAFGTEVVERIASKFDVVVRPHPQMKVSQPALYAKILDLDGVEVDTRRTPADVMARADILVSDISGIVHEFAFIHEKPVIIIDHATGHGGLEGHLLGGDSELKDRCRQFIIPIPPSEIDRIAEAVGDALSSNRRERIVGVRERTVFNYPGAGAVAADQIVEILACQ